MADNPIDPQQIQELANLYQQIYKISKEAAENLAGSITDAAKFAKELNRVKIEAAGIDDSFSGIASSLKDSIQEFAKFNVNIISSRKSLRDLQSIAFRLQNDQSGLVTLSAKELKQLREKVAIQAQSLANSIKQGNLTKTQIDETNDVITQTSILVKLIDKRLEQEKEINKALGISGTLAKGIYQVLNRAGLGGLLNLEEINAKLRETAELSTKNGTKTATFLDKTKSFATLTSGIFKSLMKDISDPAVIFSGIVVEGFKADKQITTLAKSLVITKNEANNVRQQFVGASWAINDSFITTNKLLEANSKLSEQLGLNKIYSMGMNKEFINLTQKIGIAEDSAGGLAKLSILNDKTLNQTSATIISIIEKTKQETGLRLNNKKLLEEAGKISGQLLSNFRANPKALAEAIAQVEILGTNLQQTKQQAEYLLNFESSIENELKAELLTGKSLNLERARAAALMGDQKTVAEELSKQAMDYNNFSKLNVIQQNALAQSLGLTSDQLADQLLKQQYFGKSREQIVALGGQEALQRMEALSAQEKFTSAIEKLKDLLGNIVAGPLSGLIDGFASLVNNAFILYPIVGVIGTLMIGKIAKGVFEFGKGLAAAIPKMITLLGLSEAKAISEVTAAEAATFGLATIGIIGGIAAAVAAMRSAQSSVKSVEDAYIDPSSSTIIKSSAGTFQTHPDDKIMVGTKLSPPGSSDASSMIHAMNEVKNAINSLAQRPMIVNLDGRKVGSGIYMDSYQSA